MAAQKYDPLERRKEARIQEKFDVDILLLSGDKAGDQVSGEILNLSKNGVGISIKKDLELKTELGLTIYSGEESSSCSGKIIWKKEIDGKLVYGVLVTSWSFVDYFLTEKLNSANLKNWD